MDSQIKGRWYVDGPEYVRELSNLVEKEGEGQWQSKYEQLKKLGFNVKNRNNVRSSWIKLNYVRDKYSNDESMDVLTYGIQFKGDITQTAQALQAKYTYRRQPSSIRQQLLEMMREGLKQLITLFARKKQLLIKRLSTLTYNNLHNFMKVSNSVSQDEITLGYRSSSLLFCQLMTLFHTNITKSRTELYSIMCSVTSRGHVVNMLDHLRTICRLTQKGIVGTYSNYITPQHTEIAQLLFGNPIVKESTTSVTPLTIDKLSNAPSFAATFLATGLPKNIKSKGCQEQMRFLTQLEKSKQGDPESMEIQLQRMLAQQLPELQVIQTKK